MRAKKIWIAQHPDQPGNFEVRFTEPNESGVYIYSQTQSGEDAFVEWGEYVIIKIED